VLVSAQKFENGEEATWFYETR